MRKETYLGDGNPIHVALNCKRMTSAGLEFVAEITAASQSWGTYGSAGQYTTGSITQGMQMGGQKDKKGKEKIKK